MSVLLGRRVILLQFVAVCILVGAIITMPAVREWLGRGCFLFIVGFMAIIAFSVMVVGALHLLLV
jgi:hypothetical protein